MDCIKIMPSNLKGSVKVPSSKSLSHRAIIAAGLSEEQCEISNIVFSEDIIATCNGMINMGIEITRKFDSVIVRGNNFSKTTNNVIDCMESGSTLRFMIPLALLTCKEITFTGEGALSKRPLTPYLNILDEQKIKYSNEEGLPLTIEGMLIPGEYRLPGNISSQFITGLMFALPKLNGASKIILTTELESSGYVDLTIDMLKKFSIVIENNHYREFYIKGNQKYKSINYSVEGDYSQAAFWLVGGILGDEIQCNDLNIASLQGDKVIIDILKKMGSNITLEDGIIKAKPSITKGITIDVANCPDLVPILAVLGALSEGTTNIINAGRLRLKESDRLMSISTELKKLGANIVELKDGLIIKGKKNLKGGIVDSHNDHRIAMALTIASIKCSEPLIITNSSAIRKSYPDFFDDFKMLGGLIELLYKP